MDILVFSDSHNMLSEMEKATGKHNIDRIIFLGDCVEDAEYLKKIFPQKTIMIIKGNNDLWSEYPEKIITEIEGHKIYCSHGHKERVKIDISLLKQSAKHENCDVALFGHTHFQKAKKEDEILFLNPGSIGFSGNYAILSLEKNKLPNFSLF